MKCATCKKPTKPRPENQYAPFCSSKCRMADLNQWIQGSYAIPGEQVDVNQGLPTQQAEELEN